jgi:hypothetical protein
MNFKAKGRHNTCDLAKRSETKNDKDESRYDNVCRFGVRHIKYTIDMKKMGTVWISLDFWRCWLYEWVKVNMKHIFDYGRKQTPLHVIFNGAVRPFNWSNQYFIFVLHPPNLQYYIFYLMAIVWCVCAVCNCVCVCVLLYVF